MPNPKGNIANLTGGSRKGIPNKATATMKAAIESVYQALQEQSGKPHGHFLEWAQDNETEFYKLAAKLIPIQTEVTGKDGGAIQYEQKIAEDADAFIRRLIPLAAAGAAAGAAGVTEH